MWEVSVRAGAGREHVTFFTEKDERGDVHVVSEWTFFTEHAEGMVPVPLLTLRYAPDLDDRNTAAAGKWFTIPVYPQRNGSVGAVRANTPAVEVSFDDGATWRPARVRRDGGDWTAAAGPPAGAEFVPLRSHVTDEDGNTQRQTIIQAHALR